MVCSVAHSQDAPIILNNDGNGNYTVSTTHLGCSQYCWLAEKRFGESNWQAVSSGGANYTATNMPNGIHSYRFEDVEVDEEFGISYTYTSGITTVAVGPQPEVDPFSVQVSYSYETRRGDINYDGLQDVFLNRTAGGDSGNGAIDSVILQQNPNGTFATIVPNASQLAQASSWAAVAIDLILNDGDMDGFADISLRNIGDFIPGALDQIVFSSGEIFNSAPKGTRFINQNLIDFSDDMMEYAQNPNYFDENSDEIEVGGGWTYEWECEFFYWGDALEYVCYYYRVWEDPVEVTVYPGINSDAVDVWEAILDVQQGLGTGQDILDAFSSTLGFTIGVWPWCIDLGEEDDYDKCPDILFGISIVTLADLLGHDKTSNARRANVVYLTGHDLYGFWSHSALEYRAIPSAAAAITVSAGPGRCEDINGSIVCVQVPGLTPGAILLAEENRPTDLPQFNYILGTVESSISVEPPVVYFQRIRSSSNNYNNCLDYDAYPTAGQNYNSNSYTAGLIAATDGVSEYDVNQLTGGNVPVPSVHFTSAAPTCPP